ncbi:hypothetical protein [Kingella negevensis]|nr:hypothetical protein [Kingella negevensis]MDK4681120.1 hypothetical protein [Kingella negevensis]MDK4683322.1 hypothetical protein [Kingella negevensis]
MNEYCVANTFMYHAYTAGVVALSSFEFETQLNKTQPENYFSGCVLV